MSNIEMNTGVPDETICQRERLDSSNLSKASLRQLEYTLNESLFVVQKARGQRKDPVQRLCDSAHVKKQTLARAIIFELDGDITCIELAKRLCIHPDTLRKRAWREIRNMIVAKR